MKIYVMIVQAIENRSGNAEFHNYPLVILADSSQEAVKIGHEQIRLRHPECHIYNVGPSEPIEDEIVRKAASFLK